MDRSEAATLLQQIRENRLKLDSCTRHDFGKVVGDRACGSSPRHNMRTCRRCEGQMEDRDVIIYAKGYKAAGGNPDDIGLFCDGQALC